jgi:hypothetical protein
MTSQQEIDDIIERIFQDICQMYKDVEFETKDMHDCLIRLMEIVENIPTLVGADKKKIVIGVLYLIIHHLHISESEKEKILYMLTHDIVGMIVDLIVRLTKSPSKINFRQAAKVVIENPTPSEITSETKTDATKYNYCCLL